MQSNAIKRNAVESALRVFGVVVLVLLVWSWLVNFTTHPLNPDAGYYLSAAERIYEGWKPYKDFRVSYTPVGLYYFSLFSELPFDGHISYRAGILLAQAASALLLFALSRPFIRNVALRVAAVLFYLLLMQTYDGRLIILENFVAFFGLMTILLLMKKPANRSMFPFLAGVTFSLAVLSKQYGLFIAPVVTILILFDTEGRWLPRRVALGRFLLLCAGFILPLVGFVVYIGIGLVPLFEQLRGSGYGANGFLSMISRLMDLRYVWFVGMLAISIILISRKFRFDLLVVLLTFSLGFGPLFVRTYGHYFLLILPYGVLLIAYALEQYFLADERACGRTLEKLIMVVMCVSLFIAVYDSASRTAYYGLGDGTRKLVHDKLGIHKPLLKDDLEIASRINSVFPPGTPVLLITWPQFSYYCGFHPPTKDLGYAFYTSRNKHKFDFSRIENIVWLDIENTPEADEITDKLMAHHSKVFAFSTTFYGQIELWSKK